MRKDAARQRRKMQERSAAEVRAIEEERAQQPGGLEIGVLSGVLSVLSAFRLSFRPV